jgi:hypothetical protein
MEFQKILPSDPSIVMFAKIAANQGRSPGIKKHGFYDAIVKRAEALRADGESPQQAFTKVITEDETGRLLYQAMKIAPGAEVKPVPQPAPPSREGGETPRSRACENAFDGDRFSESESAA